LKEQYETEREGILRELNTEQHREKAVASQRMEMARLRQADNDGVPIEKNGARKPRKGTAK
jgi:hypothetical protein